MQRTKDQKPHIGIFGRSNVGKSSFINFLCDQEISIVSEQAGTTTDPVKKSMEIFGLGPAVIIDTAGIDDSGILGSRRVAVTMKVLEQIDLAVLIIANNQFGDFEISMIEKFKSVDLPFVLFSNKSDIHPLDKEELSRIELLAGQKCTLISTKNPVYKEVVLDDLKSAMPNNIYKSANLFEGLIGANAKVLLITPIDSEAPEGRMILPQMMAVRHVLDKKSTCMLIQTEQLQQTLDLGIKFDLVVTDSQVFDVVTKILPKEIPLTSFSILFSRLKGEFHRMLQGTYHINKLKDNDRVLIMEACTHQVSCEDIGRCKLPRWLRNYSVKDLEIEVISGADKPKLDISEYSMAIQCGGCVATNKQLQNKIRPFVSAGIPVSNYGMTIALFNNSLNRVVEVFNNEEKP